jgi:hypothetical protein
VVDADIESFFDRLGFNLVIDCLRERINDRKVLKFVRAILGAGVLDGASLSHPTEGSPQGGPLSPVLADVVLGVQPLRAAWPPPAHQRLPGALAAEEVQTTAVLQEGQRGLAARHPPVPESLRPLGMGSRLLTIRMSGAV